MTHPIRRLFRWPDTVLGRTALVLVLALLLSVASAVMLFESQRQEALEAIGGRNAAERVGGLVAIAEQTEPDRRHGTLRRLDTPRFRVGWGTHPVVENDESFGLAAFVRDTLKVGLEGREIRVSARPGPVGGPATGMFGWNGRSRDDNRPPPPPPPGDDPSLLGPGTEPLPSRRSESQRSSGFGRSHHMIGPALRISVRLADGSWLNVLAPLDPGVSLWRPRFVAPLLLGLVLVTLAALIAVRKATLPFAVFAAAAERLGVDVGAPPMEVTGPREVRRAAHAFNVMQDRIVRFVQDRTQMLAAISHDLKTPITRLRLRAEFIEDDEQRGKMLADLAEMEQMIASTLAFARDDAAREPGQRLDLAAMVQGMLEDMEDMGLTCSYDGPDSLVIAARPVALKRAIANLLDNAVKYGGRAGVGLAVSGGEIRLTIDDDGPGIPADSRERVFAPFVRLETSRSRDTGGTGLGLAVARAAVRAHGGDIALANRAEGGLRVTLSLPQA
ncbi:sensor histidine kinase [Magnetospirillum molischianum]|uniref:histidine kinase n=1 Tax=Magnetospirillum molischianum DSM 120 TaxID=1150626 RepID=H8FQ61_MAGML|nr:ATP-binding protein [Magnetospirillum molischianum]CCG40499.1 Putative two-component sensor histidine kinase, classical system [Magnetospirillum molischianum DSM 120]